jgi:tetratricopeptide (TPR) repeat protein
MVFHARKWGWKRIAANLLLVPVLTGASAAVAHAQYNPVPQQATTNSMPGKPSGDAKRLLKEGREALKAGQFDRAQDLARAAEANNPSGKWGLFDDTPNALLRDIQVAVLKAQKSQADQLVKQAKALLAKPTPGGEPERAANLDQALQMAQRADQLHGPYSAWEFGDRPDKLIKDIQASRGKLKNVPAPAAPAGAMPGGTVVSGGTKTPQFLPTGGTGPVPGMTGQPTAAQPDARKVAAVQILAEGKRLADQNQFAAARAKFMEADRVGAAFRADEYNPGFALQDLNARGHRAVDQLVEESRKQMGKKDYAKADAALNTAAEIAASLGLFPRPIEEARGQLRTVSGGKFGGTATAAAPAGPSRTGPAVAPLGPGVHVPTSPIGAAGSPATGAKPAGPTGGVSARQLLDQAAFEFSRGELDTASRLALQAHNMPNGGVQEEARALLNSIDADRLMKKKFTAARSFEAAQVAFRNKDYNNALDVLVLIDANLLPPDVQQKRSDLIAACRTELDKQGVGSGLATAGGMQPADPPLPLPGATGEPPVRPAVPGAAPPGSARVGPDPRIGGPGSVANQADALRRAQFQKLRNDGLEIQRTATAAFGRGETDLAMQMLVDYANSVRASNLDAASVTLLITPIQSRLDNFRVMKGQTDAMARLNRETREARELIAGRGAAEEQRKTELANLVRQYHQLVKAQEFAKAERVAMQAKQLDPDNPAIGALAELARMNKRVREAEKIKADKENMFLLGMNDAEKEGPFVDIENPVKVHLASSMRAARRGTLDSQMIRSRSQAEYEIELKLDKPIQIEFNQTPLDQAVENLRTVTGLPLVIDQASLDSEGLSAVKPVTVKPGMAVSTRNILTFTLEQAGLSFVIENDLVKVTSTRKAKGRLFTKVFSVADLVTPAPNFALPDYANFDKMMHNAKSTAHIQGMAGMPTSPIGGLPGGVPTGTMAGSLATTPGISGGMPFNPGGGRLESQWQSPGPLGASAPVVGERNTKHEQLIKLITSMVRPYSWDGMGGAGKVEFFDIGSALVVNQTADVIQEVTDLLEALRRLQDLALAIEIRIVSLSETWFERMGVDFSMNIKTHTTQFEPMLTQVDPNTGTSGVFRPIPFINDINVEGVTVGLTPAGTFTGDLDVPIRPKNFERAVPPFGGYPNMPGDNGGIALGLAFLNDIQVYMFMEAAQGDRRVNVMQAPKLTLFNGQTATLTVANTQFFVANVTVISVNGQIVFIPNNSALPGPGDPLLGGSLSITVQGVVSADRRFVRLNLPITMAAQTGATVPLFPFTTFVTPIFEGGSQGQPIPFTQFLQQPSFTTLSISTTVVCPDGGTVLLGGFKQLSEGRNEFGPPVLSKIPYLNRLFKNVGIGRETTHIMIMVTPRIIINSEEEIFQTEGRLPIQQP